MIWRTLASVAAVFAGLVAFLLFTASLDMVAKRTAPSAFTPDGAHVTSTPLLIVMLAYWLVGAGVAGWVAAAVGPGHSLRHGVAAGVLLALFAAINLFGAIRRGDDPAWFHALILVAVVPAAVAGARLATKG